MNVGVDLTVASYGDDLRAEARDGDAISVPDVVGAYGVSVTSTL